MAKQISPEGNFVKKETMFIVALITLVIGFLGGVFYSALQSGPTGDRCTDDICATAAVSTAVRHVK